MPSDNDQASTPDAKILYLSKDSSIPPITLGAPIAAAGGKNFVKVSQAAVKCVGLSAAYVFARIAYRCDWPDQEGRYWEATYEDIGEDLGFSEKTVRRQVKILVEKGWLRQPERSSTWDSTTRFVIVGVVDHSRNSAEGQIVRPETDNVSLQPDRLSVSNRSNCPSLLIQDSVRLNPDGAGSVGTSIGGQDDEGSMPTPEQLLALREKIMGKPVDQRTGPKRR